MLEALPVGAETIGNWAESPWRAVCPWVAIHVFHLSGPVTSYHPTGSGDTTLDYVQVFCFFVLACIATLLWSVVDRHRPNYRTLYAWLRLLVRFTLAFTLLGYGFGKIFPMQFSAPPLNRLMQTYGESSPMGLLWTFMGASPAYTKFTGVIEAGAGTLLLFRRTTVPGALAAAGAMLNVAMLNFCYDVPVKLYSTHLFLMSLFLLLPDMSALWNFLIMHRPSRLEGVWLPKFERRWLRNVSFTLQVLVVISVLAGNIWGGYQFTNQSQPKRGDLYGIWDVENSATDAQSSAAPSSPGKPDPRWQRLIVSGTGFLTVRTSSSETANFQTKYDETKHAVHLTSRRTKQTGDLNYSLADPAQLLLRGTLDGKPIAIQMHRTDPGRFLLTTRGFHWINEDPFNR